MRRRLCADLLSDSFGRSRWEGTTSLNTRFILFHFEERSVDRHLLRLHRPPPHHERGSRAGRRVVERHHQRTPIKITRISTAVLMTRTAKTTMMRNYHPASAVRLRGCPLDVLNGKRHYRHPPRCRSQCPLSLSSLASLQSGMEIATSISAAPLAPRCQAARVIMASHDGSSLRRQALGRQHR